MVEEAINSPILLEKNIDTVNKLEKSQTSKIIVPTPPSQNPTHLTQWINQGLLKEVIYLIKVLE